MARVLIAWEFGAGLGHLACLLPVATALGKEGHRLVLALQDLGAARAAGIADRLAGTDFQVRQAPRWPIPRDPALSCVPTHSLADVLKLVGYHDTPLLSKIAESWRKIFEEAAPDLVLADFSPTLRMAIGPRVPLIVLGNGYSIPPAGRALPPIRPWEKILPPASAEAEVEVHRAVEVATKALHEPAVDNLSDLFQGTKTFVCTIPDFDPYAVYRREPSFDPFNLPGIGAAVPVEKRPANRVFVYMPGNHPDLGDVLSALRELAFRAVAYIPNMSAALKARFAGPELELHDRPLPLTEVLPAVRILIHHGGLLTAYAGLMSATPQLLMTWNLEHLVTGRGVARFGSAVVMTRHQPHDTATIATALQSLATDHRFRLAATSAARLIAERPQRHPLQGILAACRELIPA